MNFVSPSGNVVKLRTEKPFAYLIDRVDYVKAIKNNVKKNIIFSAVSDISWQKNFVTIHTNQDTIHTKLLVGADGALSIARKKILEMKKLSEPEINMGLLTRTARTIKKPISVYFNKHFSPEFFAWSIPENGEYGLIAKQPLEYFAVLQKHLGFEHHKTIIAPIATPSKDYYKANSSYCQRALLIGEAACQTKPLTAGGIDFGLKAVNHAHSTIIAAFKENDFSESMMKNYEYLWKNDFGQEIYKQLMLKNVYKKLTNKQIDSLLSLCSKHIEKIDNIDYIRIGNIWTKLPMLKLFLWYLKNLRN
jgi:flavin-dependent dehydrogenase